MNGGIPKAFTRYEEVGDWKNLCDAFAKENCEIEPGTKQRYMPDSYGWVLGHPLEVAMGKPFVEVMNELVLLPQEETSELTARFAGLFVLRRRGWTTPHLGL